MVGLDYGYRSRCCYAPIRLGRKVIKNTNKRIQIWVCTKCKTRDVNIVEYTGLYSPQATPELDKKGSFIPEENDSDL